MRGSGKGSDEDDDDRWDDADEEDEEYGEGYDVVDDTNNKNSNTKNNSNNRQQSGVNNNGGTDDNDEDGRDPLLHNHWTLAKYLPRAAAEYFYFFIGEFLYQYRHRKQALQRVRDTRRQQLQQQSQMGHNGNSTTDDCHRGREDEEVAIPMEDETINQAACDFMKQIIKLQLGTRMLRVVDELAVAYCTSTTTGVIPGGGSSSNSGGTSSTSHSAFPQQAGSHLYLESPALEFVKVITHVMSLDSALVS